MSSFRSVAFRWLWCSSVATYLAVGIQATATAWLALLAGGGGFGVGLVLAARMLPNLLFGLAAGTLADRANRNRLYVAVALAGVPVMLALSWLAAGGNVAVWQLVPLSFATGCLFVCDAPARQALVMDTVPREVAPNAMALNAMASRLCTALGALAAGALIATASVASCYLAVALAYALAVLPAIPVVGMAWGTGRYIRDETDEFERAVYIENALWATGATLKVLRERGPSEPLSAFMSGPNSESSSALRWSGSEGKTSPLRTTIRFRLGTTRVI